MAGLGLMNRRRAIASSPTEGKGVEDILANLILHYSPRLQGATNESLAASPILVDLTGHGFDLNLINFTFDGQKNGIVVDDDGEPGLLFASSPACNAKKTFNNAAYPMSRFADYTLIARREWVARGDSDWIVDINYNGNFNYATLEGGTKTVVRCKSRGRTTSVDITNYWTPEKQNVYMVTDSYNGVVSLPYTADNYGNFGTIAIGNSANKGSFKIYDIMFFDRKLEEKEIAAIIKHFDID